jgi:hypothetical protein
LFLSLAGLCFLTAFLSGCGGTTIPKIGNLVISSSSVSFGSVQVGQTATATLTLSNSGSAFLQISKIQFSSPNFALSGQVPLPITLEEGATWNLTLQFAPSAAGAAAGSLTFTATGNRSSVTVALSGTGDAIPVAPAMQLQPTIVSFGDVQVGAAAAQNVTITSFGTAPLTVSAITITGSGFTVSGLTLPATLDPGQTADFEISFDPSAAGAATGQISLATNVAAGSASVDLTGTGVTVTYQVNLSWDAPASSADPPVGYRIFRAVDGSTQYTLLNAALDDSTSYPDTTVQNGHTYTYYVESVDAEGNQSAPSNIFSATIPN